MLVSGARLLRIKCQDGADMRNRTPVRIFSYSAELISRFMSSWSDYILETVFFKDFLGVRCCKSKGTTNLLVVRREAADGGRKDKSMTLFSGCVDQLQVTKSRITTPNTSSSVTPERLVDSPSSPITFDKEGGSKLEGWGRLLYNGRLDVLIDLLRRSKGSYWIPQRKCSSVRVRTEQEQ